jgi:hypothetical protein
MANDDSRVIVPMSLDNIRGSGRAGCSRYRIRSRETSHAAIAKLSLLAAGAFHSYMCGAPTNACALVASK